MSAPATDILELLEAVTVRPAMCAGTPQAAHGMATTLAAVLLAMECNINVEEALSQVIDKCQDITADVPSAPCQAVLLCDEERHPDQRESFDAFQTNSAKLLRYLRERIGPI
jgi:hypothetical protein